MRMLGFLLLFATFLLGYHLKMLVPLQKVIGQGEEVFLGDVAPGQVIGLDFDPFSGGYGYGREDWDKIEPVVVPEGFRFEESRLQESTLQTKLIVPENAEKGVYTIKLRAIDYRMKESAYRAPDLYFTVKIKVTEDVFRVTPAQYFYFIPVGSQESLKVRVDNLGIATDYVEVRTDLPEGWATGVREVIGPRSSKILELKIRPKETGFYRFTLLFRSLSSEKLEKRIEMAIASHSNIFMDFKTSSLGIPLFPVLEVPISAFLALIGLFI